MVGTATAYAATPQDGLVIELVDVVLGLGITLVVLGIGIAARSKRRRSARLRPTL